MTDQKINIEDDVIILSTDDESFKTSYKKPTRRRKKKSNDKVEMKEILHIKNKKMESQIVLQNYLDSSDIVIGSPEKEIDVCTLKFMKKTRQKVRKRFSSNNLRKNIEIKSDAHFNKCFGSKLCDMSDAQMCDSVYKIGSGESARKTRKKLKTNFDKNVAIQTTQTYIVARPKSDDLEIFDVHEMKESLQTMFSTSNESKIFDSVDKLNVLESSYEIEEKSREYIDENSSSEPVQIHISIAPKITTANNSKQSNKIDYELNSFETVSDKEKESGTNIITSLLPFGTLQTCIGVNLERDTSDCSEISNEKESRTGSFKSIFATENTAKTFDSELNDSEAPYQIEIGSDSCLFVSGNNNPLETHITCNNTKINEMNNTFSLSFVEKIELENVCSTSSMYATSDLQLNSPVVKENTKYILDDGSCSYSEYGNPNSKEESESRNRFYEQINYDYFANTFFETSLKQNLSLSDIHVNLQNDNENAEKAIPENTYTYFRIDDLYTLHVNIAVIIFGLYTVQNCKDILIDIKTKKKIRLDFNLHRWNIDEWCYTYTPLLNVTALVYGTLAKLGNERVVIVDLLNFGMPNDIEEALLERTKYLKRIINEI